MIEILDRGRHYSHRSNSSFCCCFCLGLCISACFGEDWAKELPKPN